MLHNTRGNTNLSELGHQLLLQKFDRKVQDTIERCADLRRKLGYLLYHSRYNNAPNDSIVAAVWHENTCRLQLPPLSKGNVAS